MREKIYKIIELSDGNIPSRVYDLFMIFTIAVSLVPLAFKGSTPALEALDKVCVAVFIVDYLLRLATADFKYGRHTLGAFLRYPFSFMAIIDLLSILPSLTVLNGSFKLLRIMRMARAMRVFRAFKAARYSKSIGIIVTVFRRSREPLIAVVTLASAYIVISALVVFNVEPESFGTFFDAVYWATVSLTTVGYGDIYPVTAIGRGVTMLSSVFGVAIVALPSGIITAGYMSEITQKQDDGKVEIPTATEQINNYPFEIGERN